MKENQGTCPPSQKKKKITQNQGIFQRKKIGTQSSQMPFQFMIKVKEAFDLRTSYIPFLIRVIFITFMKFFLFHL